MKNRGSDALLLLLLPPLTGVCGASRGSFVLSSSTIIVARFGGGWDKANSPSAEVGVVADVADATSGAALAVPAVMTMGKETSEERAAALVKKCLLQYESGAESSRPSDSTFNMTSCLLCVEKPSTPDRQIINSTTVRVHPCEGCLIVIIAAMGRSFELAEVTWADTGRHPARRYLRTSSINCTSLTTLVDKAFRWTTFAVILLASSMMTKLKSDTG